MTLNEPDGYMYEFITHTWNPIRGKCFHGCTYCYMQGKWSHPCQYLEIKELTGAFESGQFIFIGSSTDFCSEKVKSEWIKQVFDFCYKNNQIDIFGEKAKFLLQTKNPERLLEFFNHPLLNPENDEIIICTTLETNRHLHKYMQNAPAPRQRAEAMAKIANQGIKTYVTIEPIMDFDLEEFVELIRMCRPEQVNIGKNTSKVATVPNPTIQNTVALVKELLKFTNVEIKSNSGQLKEALSQVGIKV